jgi:hypothetical protein
MHLLAFEHQSDETQIEFRRSMAERSLEVLTKLLQRSPRRSTVQSPTLLPPRQIPFYLVLLFRLSWAWVRPQTGSW